MSMDATAILVGLGAAALALGAAVALVLRGRMRVLLCRKCGEPLWPQPEGNLCTHCLSNMFGGPG